MSVTLIYLMLSIHHWFQIMKIFILWNSSVRIEFPVVKDLSFIFIYNAFLNANMQHFQNLGIKFDMYCIF